MLLFGYDQGVMSGLIGSESFKAEIFGTQSPSSSISGVVVAIYEIGAFVGAISVMLFGRHPESCRPSSRSKEDDSSRSKHRHRWSDSSSNLVRAWTDDNSEGHKWRWCRTTNCNSPCMDGRSLTTSSSFQTCMEADFLPGRDCSGSKPRKSWRYSHHMCCYWSGDLLLGVLSVFRQYCVLNSDRQAGRLWCKLLHDKLQFQISSGSSDSLQSASIEHDSLPSRVSQMVGFNWSGKSSQIRHPGDMRCRIFRDQLRRRRDARRHSAGSGT